MQSLLIRKQMRGHVFALSRSYTVLINEFILKTVKPKPKCIALSQTRKTKVLGHYYCRILRKLVSSGFQKGYDRGFNGKEFGVYVFSFLVAGS